MRQKEKLSSKFQVPLIEKWSLPHTLDFGVQVP